MSLRGPRCGKHPSHILVGVCSFCLRERLAGLVDVDCASDAHPPNSKKKKDPSPGRALVVHGSHPISKPSGKRGFDQPIVINSATHAPIAPGRTHALVHKGDKPTVLDTVLHVAANGNKTLNEHIISKSYPKPSVDLACEPISRCSLKQNGITGSITVNDADAPIIGDVGCDKVACSTKIPASRHSFSSVRRSSLASMESSKLPPVDIKVPISENNQHTQMEAKSTKLVQKHTSIECPPSLTGINEQAKLVPFENKVHLTASFDSERSSFNTLLGAQRSLPFHEPRIESDLSRKDAEIVLSDASPNPKHKKKTLSSLFSLDDAEFPTASKAKTEDSENSSRAKGDVMFNGSSSAPAQNILQAKMGQRRCRHGSFSERVEPSKYLFPVPESGNSKPLSWFSSLFRRRKKKSHAKSIEALASFSEHNNGWEDARQSWEAPRPSSWEQFRFSSFEGPRSSWEPARPSWEGVMRTSDGESVFSGFDFLTESLAEVREDPGIDRKNPQEHAGDCANGFADARRFAESKRLGLKSKSLAPKIPHLEDKDRAHTFLSAKAMLMQRDVSTQTTPPRSSDATEIFIQQRLQHDQHRRRQYAKVSHAVWSKVWTKTFSNSKWAFKQKHHKERRLNDMGDATTVIDEVHDQGNMTSGRSSFYEGANAESNHHVKLAQFDNIKEHEGWDTFYSPSQQSRNGGNVPSKGDACMQKDEHIDKVRGSNFTLENGLLKFYLTPVRGHGIRGKSKQGIHGL